MKILFQKSYYLELLPMDLVYKVLEKFPSEEQKQAQELLAELMDITALRTILTNLSAKNDKLAFLEIYRDQYDQSYVLDWAVLKIDNINIRLQEALERALLAAYQKIQDQL